MQIARQMRCHFGKHCDTFKMFDSFYTHTEFPTYVSVLHTSTVYKIRLETTHTFSYPTATVVEDHSSSLLRSRYLFSPPVSLLQLTFHSSSHKGIFFPLKRHSRYNDFQRHCRFNNLMFSCVHQGNLHVTPVPSKLTKYAQKTLYTKTPLSRGLIGKTFPDTEKKN